MRKKKKNATVKREKKIQKRKTANGGKVLNYVSKLPRVSRVFILAATAPS